MKVETGQYFRDKYNVLRKCLGTTKFLDNILVHYTRNYATHLEDIIKVAGTPMELLQDEDIIRYKMYVGSDQVETKSIPLAVCGNMKDEVMIYAGSMLIPHDWVTDILTPNSSGGYDLQYSKEAE